VPVPFSGPALDFGDKEILKDRQVSVVPLFELNIRMRISINVNYYSKVINLVGQLFYQRNTIRCTWRIGKADIK
jgi:hypothetical protein